MFASLAFLAALFAAPCKSTGALGVYVDGDAIRPRDSVAAVRVCLTVPSRGAKIASLSGRFTVDTAFATVADVVRAPKSPFVANANGPGSVLVAGAASGAVRSGAIVTVTLKLAHAGVVPRVDFMLTELNEANGRSLVTRALARPSPPRCAAAAPGLFEVLPAVASADPGEPLDLRISGCGFNATRNTIHFGDITVPNARSTDGGTRIRVVVPKEYRTSAEVPPMALGAGEYDVTVNNGKGKSNARRVTLR